MPKVTFYLKFKALIHDLNQIFWKIPSFQDSRIKPITKNWSILIIPKVAIIYSITCINRFLLWNQFFFGIFFFFPRAFGGGGDKVRDTPEYENKSHRSISPYYFTPKRLGIIQGSEIVYNDWTTCFGY